MSILGILRGQRRHEITAPTAGTERRRSPRRAVEIPLEFGSTFSLPRGTSGVGVVEDIGEHGARIRVSRALRNDQWLRLELRPSLRARNAMPEAARHLSIVKARVVRETVVDDAAAGYLVYGYGVRFEGFRSSRWLSVLDGVLPWLGLALILGAAADVVWMRSHNLKHFWNHPLINFYGLMISSYILSRIALACRYAPPGDVGYLPKVTVAVACKNEEGSIRQTLDCIFRSDYPTELMEVIAVDDGSTDGTWAEMQDARAAYPALNLIRFEKNRGKRHAMAAAARKASGEIVVYVDSDSFLQRDAVRRIVQGFADPQVGAVCGHARVENARVNFLTRMQEVRYYVAFRIVKAAESLFSAVTCCSGCLSAYRRSYMEAFLDVWLNQRFLGVPATFGDDRSLTNFMLRRYRVIYDCNAICSTIVPESLRVFLRQQLRWKKSWLRENLLISTFMWKRHPLAAFFFYLSVLFPLVSPIVVSFALLLPLVGVGQFSYFYLYGTMLMALIYGLVYLVRHKNELWIYGFLFSLFYMAVLVWQTYYALATLRRNHWGTR